MERHALHDCFLTWLKESPQAYELFVKYTLEIVDVRAKRFFAFFGRKQERVYKKTSAWLVANRVRWEGEVSGVTEYGQNVEIPNDYIALMARKFMRDHPHLGEVFCTRQMSRA